MEVRELNPASSREWRIYFKKEVIFALVEDDKTKIETRTPEEIKRITTYFYIDP